MRVHRTEESWICRYDLQIPQRVESEREERLIYKVNSRIVRAVQKKRDREREISVKKLLTNSALKHFYGVWLEVNKIQFISSSKATFPLISKEFLDTAAES